MSGDAWEWKVGAELRMDVRDKRETSMRERDQLSETPVAVNRGRNQIYSAHVGKVGARMGLNKGNL